MHHKDTQQTPWMVFTGGPSSGKTTLVNVLARTLQVPVRAEIATEVIRKRIAETGLQDDEALRLATADQVALQWAIHQANLKSEQELDPHKPHLLDRGALDVVAYERLYDGGRHDQMLAEVASLRRRYRFVFQLDLLPLERNDVRIENDETAQNLDRLYAELYRAAGYDVIRVPVLPVPQRVAFVLQHYHKVWQPEDNGLSS